MPGNSITCTKLFKILIKYFQTTCRRYMNYNQIFIPNIFQTIQENCIFYNPKSENFSGFITFQISITQPVFQNLGPENTNFFISLYILFISIFVYWELSLITGSFFSWFLLGDKVKISAIDWILPEILTHKVTETKFLLSLSRSSWITLQSRSEIANCRMAQTGPDDDSRHD